VLTDGDLRVALQALKAICTRRGLPYNVPFREFTDFRSYWMRQGSDRRHTEAGGPHGPGRRRGVTVEQRALTVRVHDEGEGTLWAEVVELPGCFATGDTEDELFDHVLDAIATVLDVERSDLDKVEWGERVDVEAVRERRVSISS
jgi:predicted RNase H-like HicB family nuclease